MVEETHPPFQVAAVLPNANFGPIIEPNGEEKSVTSQWLLKLWNGDDSVFEVPPQWLVDVRDTARLHVAALIDPTCNGQRVFAFAFPFTWNDLLAIMRKVNPEKKFIEDRDAGQDLSEIPNEEAESLLRKHYGHGFTPVEETVRAAIVPFK